MESPHSMRGPSPEASGHTPGPWHIDARQATAPLGYGHKARAATFYVHGPRGAHQLLTTMAGPDAQANARLIASAPEMFDALRALLATSDLNFDSLEPDTVRAIQAARAVMQKVQP